MSVRSAVSGAAVTRETKPPVYAIVLNQLTDPEGYAKDYLPKGRAAILAHGGVYVAAGKGNVITGDVKADRVVVLRFESLDAVQKWFNSPDYQAAKSDWPEVREVQHHRSGRDQPTTLSTLTGVAIASNDIEIELAK